MTAEDDALLEELLQRSGPVEDLVRPVRETLELQKAWDRAFDEFAFERHVYQMAGSPAAEAETYRQFIIPHAATALAIQSRIDRWMEERLRKGAWLGFGLPVPAGDQVHALLLPTQWLALRLKSDDGVAAGGGRRYELVRVVDLARLKGHAADNIADFLKRYAEEVRARADAARREKASRSAPGESIAPDIAATLDQAVDRRLQDMLGATGALPVAVKEIAPEALMRVQVAAMEIPAPAATTPASSDAQRDGDSERARRPPGRPSMREPLRAQMFVRAQQGMVAKGVGEEARQLRAWAIGNKQEGDPPVPLADTIENVIRRDYPQALAISNGVKSLMAKNK